jgi:Domain of unknown function (DUF4345)
MAYLSHLIRIEHPRYRALAVVLRIFAAFAIVTGALDVATGTELLIRGGAQLGEAARDAVLNSQIKYWGAVWCGFGVALWWTTRDLQARIAMLFILLGTVFFGGLGRSLSALLFGAGSAMLTAFILIELIGPVAVLMWFRRLNRLSAVEVGHVA